MKTWLSENRNRIVESFFYLALTIELLLMIVEKSEISFSQESHIFRVTFLLTFLAVLLMEHSRKEWFVIGAVWVLTFACYMLSGKNDLLRVATFMMAARDVDLKKVMKYIFHVCAAGFLLIAVLSCAKILGSVSMVMDYGRDAGVEKRYVFGFGHPNTLFSSVYMLILIWLWTYGKKAGALAYMAIVALSTVLAYITRTRTGAVILGVTMLLAVLFRIFPKLSKVGALYVLETIVSPVLCVVSAIMAAWACQYVYLEKGPQEVDERFWIFEEVLNYRISSIYYEAQNRDAVLSGWKLFAVRGADSYFDMGWVRLFYWYGIIPVAVMIVALLAVIYVCYKKHDIWTMVIIFSLSVYTIVEATFVTRYIGRDFFLIIAGVYLGYLFSEKFSEKGELDA